MCPINRPKVFVHASVKRDPRGHLARNATPAIV